MKSMKYSEIIKENKVLENHIEGRKYKIHILSNIMVHQAKDICEFSLRKEKINAHVVIGDYDNILQNSIKLNDVNAVIIFWEVYNFIDGFQYKADLLTTKEFNQIVDKIKNEIDILFSNLQTIPLVLINQFSSLIFEQYNLQTQKLSELSNILNEYIRNKIHSNGVISNIKMVETDKIIAQISTEKAIDLRFFYTSKTLYTIDFYKTYFDYIKYFFLSINGKSKKALIFDCDNTLWKGIVGEDSFEDIKIYTEIQSLALALSKKGVIIGLCSKNNPDDIDNIIKNHDDMILSEDDIVIKKVNWSDKVSNLKAIASDLNIGLESIVFIDDSDFEVNLVRQELPMLTIFQVPKKEYYYAFMLRKMHQLFYNLAITNEDSTKSEMYKAQFQREKVKQQNHNIEDYLKLLKLKMTVYIDELKQYSRIAQLTQKTNQFNLTTTRYTEQDIRTFIAHEHMSIVTIRVSDRYGDSGIVGLSIIDYTKDIALIDTLLLSCRVLGRNIEYKFMDIIVKSIQAKKVLSIQGKYLKTAKNNQVSHLYNQFGFKSIKESEHLTNYYINTAQYKKSTLSYIKVEYGK